MGDRAQVDMYSLLVAFATHLDFAIVIKHGMCGPGLRGCAVGGCGCRYLAPECLRGGFLTGPYAERVDVFALGASLVELASGNELASGGQPYQRLRSGHMPLLPHVRMGMQNLLKVRVACTVAAFMSAG